MTLEEYISEKLDELAIYGTCTWDIGQMADMYCSEKKYQEWLKDGEPMNFLDH